MGKFRTDSHLMARETLHTPVSEEVFNLSEHEVESEDAEKRIRIASLATGDALTVRTCNSLYRLVMLDPTASKVLIRGGRYFPQPSEACLLGSAIGRKIQIGHIVVGRGLGFSVGRRCFITSPIELIEPGKPGEEKAENGAA